MYGVSFVGDKNILELDSSDSFTTLWLFLKTLNCKFVKATLWYVIISLCQKL